MSYDFYVLEGKKLIDYKPKAENYSRAFNRLMDSIDYITNEFTMYDMKEKHYEDFCKILFLMIKMHKHKDCKLSDKNAESVKGEFGVIEIIGNMVGLLTPREFMQMFPIEKEFDGEKYECKDYFYTVNYIEEFGIDTIIGDKASEFLMEYWNWDVNEYMVYWMSVVNRMHMLQGGKDILIEFMEEQGVQPRTLHQEGDYMVDDETGERFKIKKPKNPMKKLFSVVE